MFYTTWDIVPKTLLETTFDVFVLIAKVIDSISEYRRKNFWKNRFQSYRSKVWRVRFITLFINQDGSCSSPWFRYWFSSENLLTNFKTKLQRMEHLLKDMMEIWSRGQGELEAFILLTILHILLDVGGERSGSTDGLLNFGSSLVLIF